MKKTILSIALLLSVVSSLTSCMVSQERRGQRYNNRDRYYRHHDRHRGPYDSNYSRYH
jgi:hypothetical protein